MDTRYKLLYDNNSWTDWLYDDFKSIERDKFYKMIIIDQKMTNTEFETWKKKYDIK